MTETKANNKTVDKHSKFKSNKKEEMKTLMNQLVPLFRLKPMGSDCAVCKYLGNVKMEEKIYDEPLEVNEIGNGNGEGKNIIANGAFGSYEIVAKACMCNIVGNYLLKNTKLPIYYVTVLYDKKFVSGYLFTLFLYFTMSDETKKELNHPRKYLNKSMRGKFTLELVSDDDFLSKLVKDKTVDIEKEIMEKYIEKFDGATDEEKANIMVQIGEDVTKKLDEYRDMFNPVEITDLRKKSIIQKMRDICGGDNMGKLIRYGLEMREQERIDQSCPDQDYKRPKRVINLKELRDNPDTIDQRIDDLIDNRSSGDESD